MSTEIQFFLLSLIIQYPLTFLILLAWSFIIKGAALLRAFERKERGWFIALLLINAVGILEVYYLYTMKVAKIKEAIRVEKSEKLIKLQLELGEESRQIVAGIGKAYRPDELIGKEIIIVANLAPRALMGVESHGMLLAAGGAENPVLLTPEKKIESGAKVK
ncbi:MAG: Methionine-tRNA ligase [Candidatus Wolfebacteria bacterium GW2011_GWA2_47_9b]|uniref:Methionine--tRNA ligase n=1 Tax=Candidatus Wolfebacteria bacterium GW2011_GWA2_47_9b TaxID=1619005 RepID=A0A0G1X6V6_9BACT|nr:MAG: Methionine-tRNA ligase [Candidatus Wolfebacteria bacterium GW2011_GWA2_47_9b]